MAWGRERKSRREKQTIISPEYIPSEQEMGKIHSAAEGGEGVRWSGEDRMRRRGEVLAAARGPVMSDLHP